VTETGLLNMERYRGQPIEKSILQVVDNLETMLVVFY